MPPIENMKNALLLVIVAAAVHLLVGAFAADESLAAAQREEAEAMNSRDFAAKRACGPLTPVWESDMHLVCLKEAP